LKKGLEDAGLDEMAVGKGDPVFLVNKPSYRDLTKVLPGIALPTAPNVEGYATVEAGFWAAKLYNIVSLFLGVHTYPYSHGDDIAMDDSESAVSGALKRTHISTDVDPGLLRKKVRLHAEGIEILNEEGHVWEEDDIEEEEEENASSTKLAIAHAVLSAKPSPFTCNINIGTPSDVPFIPGLLFPYFPGLLSPDPNFIRTSAISHFFRNLGSEVQSPRDAYKSLRSAIPTFGYTTEGVILTHILKGVELALSCQAVLYLLMDGKSYLGFCLLGAKFHVFYRGVWVAPKSGIELGLELKEIQTHDDCIEELYTKLRGLPQIDVARRPSSVEVMRTSVGLARALGNVDWTKLEKEEDEDTDNLADVTQLVKCLSFPANYRRYGPKDLVWLVEELTSRIAEPFPSDQNIHIPLGSFHLLGRKEMLALLSFGPRSPSFRMTTGTEYKVPKEVGKADDPFAKVDDKGKVVVDKLIVGEKLPHVALQEWDALVSSGKVRFEPNERAIGSRAHAFRGDLRAAIWGALAKGVQEKKLGTKGQAGTEGEGRPFAAGSFGAQSIDDFFS
jgi:hypothetical protein